MQRAALDQASGQGPGDELHLGQLGLQQGELLTWLGRPDDGEEWIRRAMRLQ